MSSRFRLGIVLRLREVAEDAARAELAVALRGHREALASVERARRAAADERGRATGLIAWAARPGGTPVRELAAASGAVERADRDLAACEARLLDAGTTLMDARRRLGEASKRRQVVERLRDRFVAAEAQRAARREEAVLGEIATTRHAWTALEEADR